MRRKRVMFRTGDAVQIGDLALIDGHPHLVWKWNGDSPVVVSWLDPRQLQTDTAHLPPGIDAVYGQEVENPQKLQ